MEALQLSEEDLIPESSFDRFSQRAKRLLTDAQAETRQTVERMTGAEVEETGEEGTG